MSSTEETKADVSASEIQGDQTTTDITQTQETASETHATSKDNDGIVDTSGTTATGVGAGTSADATEASSHGKNDQSTPASADQTSSASQGPTKRSTQSIDREENPAKRVATSSANSDDLRHIKLLIPRPVVGSLIGRGGENMAQLQALTGASVRLSQASESFPTTDERVCMIACDPERMSMAVATVLSTASQGTGVDQAPAVRSTARIVVSNGAAGLIIGKGGETIREISAKTGSRLQMSQKDEVPSIIGERILTISNSDTSLPLAAIDEVVQILVNNPEVCEYKNKTTSYRQLVGGLGGLGGFSGSPSFATAPGIFSAPAAAPAVAPVVGGSDSNSLVLYVPDERVGSILGRGGSNLRDIEYRSQCRVQISQKGEYAPGTHDRIVTILGSPGNTAIAKQLIDSCLVSGYPTAPSTPSFGSPYGNPTPAYGGAPRYTDTIYSPYSQPGGQYGGYSSPGYGSSRYR